MRVSIHGALAVAAASAVLAAGCGGSGGGQTADDVLRGLENAAKSKKTFDALRKSNDLETDQKAVINAFCSVTTQLADNNETLQEQEYFNRISTQVESELGYLSSPADSVLSKLRATYDLANINPRAAQYYARACYR